MIRAALAVFLLFAAGGCAQFLGSPQPQQDDVPLQIEKLTEAQKLQRDGKFGEAQEAFKKIIKNYPASEWAASAMFGNALILVSADNSKRDYAQALAEFDEFLSQFPQHRRAPEARSWRQVLKAALDAKKENERLSNSIEKLKQLDLKQEEKRLGR